MTSALGEVSPRWDSARAAIVCWLVVGAFLRLLFAALIPLFPDEAYYWEWSRHLAAGYFDHPPAIPLLIRGGTSIFGATSLGVRFLPVVAGLVAALATAGIARLLGGVRAALDGAIIITCIPLAAAGLVLATPDSPLLATSAVGVYALVRALQSPPRSRASFGWWVATGIALGLAFCSKYTSILMPVGVTLAVLTRPSLRARLGEPGPYVACVIAALIFLPVLRWNAAHDWISFGFQLHHGLAPSAHRDLFAPLKRLGDMLGGQAALVSPILFVLLAIATAVALRRIASDASYTLAMIGAFTFIFFCYSASRQRVEPNWPAPAYIAAIPLLAALPRSGGRERWFRGGVWLAGTVSVLIYLHAAFGVLPIPPRKDPIARAAGWSSLAGMMSTTEQRMAIDGPGHSIWLAADRYQDAAELAFHLPDHPTVFSLNFAGRTNQYELWPGFPDRARPGDDLIVALDESAGLHPVAERLTPYFHLVMRDSIVDLATRRGVVTRRRLWVFRGWIGSWPKRS